MRHSARLGIASIVGVSLGWISAAVADPPDAPNEAPTGSFFSSLKQALKQDLNYEVVRGHFDVGAAPDSHRFYCLVDVRSGKNEEYGVGGEPFVRPDGMTGIKAGAVSPDSCAKAEEQGRLVTAGYIVNLGAKAKASAPSPSPSTPPPRAVPEIKSAGSPDRIDVAGVRLGMSTDQVRAALKSKLLASYFESTALLAAGGGRYVNVIAAWTTVPGDEESFEVLFTPVPGKERVMVIIHSAPFASTGSGAAALSGGLVAKYGGYAAPGDVPDAPTWRLQSAGTMLTGDACNRRSLFGGMHSVDATVANRQNPALTTTADEFRYQIEQCGVAIVTEDHVNDRFTVSAYSPSIGLEGATTATQLIQAATGSAARSAAQRAPTPNL